MSSGLSESSLLELLATVNDPELPMVNIVELGIVRGARASAKDVTVTLTPTYSGCPAMDVIEEDIRSTLLAAGVRAVTIERVYAPPWTTDWITEEARNKLAAAGIAPPLDDDGVGGMERLVSLPSSRTAPKCPRCGSTKTKVTSEYGATSCKALCVCTECKEPFEHFKKF